MNHTLRNKRQPDRKGKNTKTKKDSAITEKRVSDALSYGYKNFGTISEV